MRRIQEIKFLVQVLSIIKWCDKMAKETARISDRGNFIEKEMRKIIKRDKAALGRLAKY